MANPAGEAESGALRRDFDRRLLPGEPRVCSMVPVPDEADEDARRCVRERIELISERVGLTNRTASGGSFDSIRTNEKISRNFPRLTDLVDHVHRERAPP
jgi:hypothetical protein